MRNKKRNCSKMNSLPFMMVGAVKTRPLSTEEIPPEKNSFFNISENQVCFKYF